MPRSPSHSVSCTITPYTQPASVCKDGWPAGSACSLTVKYRSSGDDCVCIRRFDEATPPRLRSDTPENTRVTIHTHTQTPDVPPPSHTWNQNQLAICYTSIVSAYLLHVLCWRAPRLRLNRPRPCSPRTPLSPTEIRSPEKKHGH